MGVFESEEGSLLYANTQLPRPMAFLPFLAAVSGMSSLLIHCSKRGEAK